MSEVMSVLHLKQVIFEDPTSLLLTQIFNVFKGKKG